MQSIPHCYENNFYIERIGCLKRDLVGTDWAKLLRRAVVPQPLVPIIEWCSLQILFLSFLQIFLLLKVNIHCTSLHIFTINLKLAVMKSAPCLTFNCEKVKERPTGDLAALCESCPSWARHSYRARQMQVHLKLLCMTPPSTQNWKGR